MPLRSTGVPSVPVSSNTRPSLSRMNKSGHCWFAFTLGLLALGGCSHHHHPASDATTPPKESLVPTAAAPVAAAAQHDATVSGNQLKGHLGSVVVQGGELAGGDANGRPLWRISADTIRASGQSMVEAMPDNADLTHATARLYRDGQLDSILTAHDAQLYKTKKGIRLHMTGGVTGVSEGAWKSARGPVTFSAPEADVDVSARLIGASDGFQAKQGPVTVSSPVAHADTSLATMVLTGGVTATGPEGKLVADTGRWDWKANLVNATNATATHLDTTLRGDHMNGDVALRTGTATGHVHAVNPKGTADGDRLDFDWARNIIRGTDTTLTGPNGVLNARAMTTDSKLTLTSASGVTVHKGDAVLTAATGVGFDKLSHITGNDVTLKRGTMTIRAPRGTWGGGRITGTGGVNLESAGSTYQAAGVDADDKFQNATISGVVHGALKDRSRLVARDVVKTGPQLVASGGASLTLPPESSYGLFTFTGDKLVAQADGSSADLTGHVHGVSTEGATIVANQAHFDGATHMVTAQGDVLFTDPKRGLKQRGDTLRVDLLSKEATLSNVHGVGSQQLFGAKKLF